MRSVLSCTKRVRMSSLLACAFSSMPRFSSVPKMAGSTWVVAVGLQQLLKGVFGQQFDVFGKHTKQSAGQVSRYGFRSYHRRLRKG